VRLRDALEAAFQESPAFELATTSRPNVLVVYIPRAVEWRPAGNRHRATFRVELRTRSGKLLGSSRGSCWDDQMRACAAHVLRDAAKAARRLR
jgi:hypothetical protein